MSKTTSPSPAAILARLRAELATAGRLILRVKVTPRAPQTELAGQLVDGTLKVKVAAVPEHGKANSVLQKWLAQTLEGRATLLSGAGEPLKLFRISQ